MAEDMKFKYYYQDERGRIRASEENVPTDSDLIADFSETGEGGGGSSDISISVNNTTYTPSEEGVITLPDYPEAGMTNPMTAAGDIIYGNNNAQPGRLRIGENGTVLTSNGSYPSWKEIPADDKIVMSLADFLGLKNKEMYGFTDTLYDLSIKSEDSAPILLEALAHNHQSFPGPTAAGEKIVVSIGMIINTSNIGQSESITSNYVAFCELDEQLEEDGETYLYEFVINDSNSYFFVGWGSNHYYYANNLTSPIYAIMDVEFYEAEQSVPLYTRGFYMTAEDIKAVQNAINIRVSKYEP